MPRMHEDQVDVGVDDVRRLLAHQMPHWAELPIVPVAEAGTDHALYRLGEDLVARLPVIAGSAGQAAREAAWLPPLARLLPVQVSVPVALGEPDGRYPFAWSVNPWLPGTPVDPSTVDAAPLAVDLAGFLRALQAVDTAGAGLFGSRGHPLSEPTRDRLTRASLAAAGDVVDAERALAVWEDAQAAPAWPGPPTWFHGDLNAGNLLTREGRLSAVLDWGPWGAGDPAVDLHAAYQLFDEASREQFRCEVGADHATWVRARGWAVSVAAMEIPYYRETRPEFAARSIAAIDAVLAE